jgi:SAM-dependent methyltransferase
VSTSGQTISAYSENAGDFAQQYEALSAEATWEPFRDLMPSPNGKLAIDIGAGSGRDAAWLATLGFEVIAAEPASGMRVEGQRWHPELRWVDDRLPELKLVHSLGLGFDLVILNAVWMHIRPTERGRAFRKIVALLKPGSLMLLTLRHGPSQPGREMFAVSLGEVEALARDHGLSVLRVVQLPDGLGREEVSWTMVCLRLPDDGTMGLPIIRGVILNDDKSSTYKLALLRAIAKIADNTPSMAETAIDTDRVELPLGLIALNWIRMYLPLVAAGMPQAPNNHGPDGLGFAKVGFRSLISLGMTAQELRLGAAFSSDRFAAVVAAISEARNTIVNMPVRYITLPNSTKQLFVAAGRRAASRPSGPTLDMEVMKHWGSLSVPGPLWRTMLRLGVWIEPLLLAEWSRLTRNYAARMGMAVLPGSIEARLVWIEPTRDTALARAAAARLEAGGNSIICAWSNARLNLSNLDIDHALPWSAWPCGDLWNLLPTSRRINQHQKRDCLPSAAALARAREPILNWWREAWIFDPGLAQRFETEARAALPIEGTLTEEKVFAGLEWAKTARPTRPASAGMGGGCS